ncbi:hypothetical protein [Pelagibius marinus]|uniref:hypothetical protein n=1 Tax=Pelagibius marinus TaxID=2762760 RepID=UPI0018732185|nr:hypothetical protein [Pelagibius marinus]
MRDTLTLGMLKLETVKRFALDNEGALVLDFAFIGALVAVAGIVALVLADDAMDWVLIGVSEILGD